MAQVPAVRRQNQTALSLPPSVSAELYAGVGRYAGAAVLTAFEQLGGIDGLVEWAGRTGENEEAFYTRIFTKIVSSPKQVEVSGTLRIEEAIKALDLHEGSGYTVVSETPDYDPSQF